MDTMIYLDQENGALSAPVIKCRHRLQSAPEQRLKTPLNVKTRLGAPGLSARKALGTVNKIPATPAASHKSELRNKAVEVQCKVTPQPARQDYPEIEKCFPYNPSDFESYSVPEEVHLSCFSLAGLGRQHWSLALPEADVIDPDLPQSPLNFPSENCIGDLEAFLETIHQLTVDLPPESDY